MPLPSSEDRLLLVLVVRVSGAGPRHAVVPGPGAELAPRAATAWHKSYLAREFCSIKYQNISFPIADLQFASAPA